jgi:hypothetical protein
MNGDFMSKNWQVKEKEGFQNWNSTDLAEGTRIKANNIGPRAIFDARYTQCFCPYE